MKYFPIIINKNKNNIYLKYKIINIQKINYIFL